MKHLSIFTTAAIRGLGVLFFAAAAWAAWQNSVRIYQEMGETGFLFAWTGALLLAGGMILYLSRLLSRTWFMLLLAIGAGAVRLLWVLHIPTPIESDFAMLYQSAVQAARGNFSFSQLPYFQSWVYQVGFTMYEAGVIALFGNHVLLLKGLSIVYSAGTAVLVYLTGRELVGEMAGRAAGILYAGCTSSIVMTSVLTNDYLSTLLYMLGFYFIVKLKEPAVKAGLLIGLCLAAGNLIRPLGSFILIAVFLYYIYLILTKPEQRRRTAGALASIFAAYFLVMNITSAAFMAAGVTEHPLSNRAPYWKFVLGLNPDTKGGYSEQDAQLMGQLPIGEVRDQAEKELVLQRLSDRPQVLQLFLQKFTIMWGEENASLRWSMSTLQRPFVQKQAQVLEHAGYGITLLLAGGFLLFGRSYWRTPLLFLLLLVLGYAAVHLLIEIQTRYRFFILPIFTILAGGGAAGLLGQLNAKKESSR